MAGPWNGPGRRSIALRLWDSYPLSADLIGHRLPDRSYRPSSCTPLLAPSFPTIPCRRGCLGAGFDDLEKFKLRDTHVGSLVSVSSVELLDLIDLVFKDPLFWNISDLNNLNNFKDLRIVFEEYSGFRNLE